MKSITYCIFISLLLYNCTPKKQQQIPLQTKIQGSWIDARYAETEQSTDTGLIIKTYNSSPFQIPIGINFQKNKLEYFKQFIEYKLDTITRKRSYDTFVGFVPYQLKADSLFIQHPLKDKLLFKCTIDASKKDTLLLKKKDTTYLTLVPLVKKPKDSLQFDQVVLSRSGCFGSCPIMNISIQRDGRLVYYGEKFTDHIGVFQGKLSPEFTNYIFKKLEDIQISKVDEYYSVGHTDDETISSTFLKNGNIVKTISDYGQAGTKEMLWAYCATLNLDKQIKLSSIPFNTKVPILDRVYFEKGTKRLFLEKSEGFLLWQAFQNATITPANFEKKYTFHGGYFRSSIKKIESDGQLYKVYLKDGHMTTYDLGYNFIEKNFTETDFKKLE
ncbi:DUF6438 domain-containing protein [uncultured Kordia sp.]|uniref:DUF6438 domain-containing protein n=1 Tax=uncultured Kordia sp. TaxID=507699 RepID=UPI0026188796|nr:DUF6438 domain-containing protein [uncultured Kordia sp.]